MFVCEVNVFLFVFVIGSSVAGLCWRDLDSALVFDSIGNCLLFVHVWA